MKSHKRLTLLALAVLGLTNQVVLADDTSHSTTTPMTSSISSSTNTSTSHSTNSSTNTSASSSQASTETSSSTASSSEQESKPSLSRETKPNQPIQTGWVKGGEQVDFYSQTGVKFTDTLYDGYFFDSHGYLLENSWYQWETIGTISMVQVNIYPTNGAKSMASGMLLMAMVECWPMSGKAITTSNPVVLWQIRNGSTTKATLVGFTSNLADAMPKTMDWFLLS